MTYDYDGDTWEATLVIDGKKYTYEMSPYHWREFRKKLRRNFGRAMAYIKAFRKGE